MGLGFALAKIPWKTILPYVPAVVETAKELLRSASKSKSADLATADASPQNLLQRIEHLETNERKQAELIERMAEQQQQLTESLRIVESRVQVLFWLTLALLVVAVGLLVYHFLPGRAL
jgi:hypothetical protein